MEQKTLQSASGNGFSAFNHSTWFESPCCKLDSSSHAVIARGRRMVVVDWAKQQEEPKCHEIKTMGWHNDAEAKRLLTDAAAQQALSVPWPVTSTTDVQVQPIMRKRGWIVPLLTEFYPPNACLLGLNIGGGGVRKLAAPGRTREVRVRLRQARDRTLFFPFEHVLGTLLHELVHNVQGPHNSVFYKLLDELNDECDELMAKGITGSGAGFHGPSKGRLGSHAFVPLHNPPSTALREVAARAAEERAKKQRLMTRGPCCVGRASGQASGSLDWRSLTPAQAAAQAAARRAADNQWCPSEQLAGLSLESIEAGGAGGGPAGQGAAGGPAGQGAAGGPAGQGAAGGSAGQGAGGIGRSQQHRAEQGGQRNDRPLRDIAQPDSAGAGARSRPSHSCQPPGLTRAVAQTPIVIELGSESDSEADLTPAPCAATDEAYGAYDRLFSGTQATRARNGLAIQAPALEDSEDGASAHPGNRQPLSAAPSLVPGAEHIAQLEVVDLTTVKALDTIAKNCESAVSTPSHKQYIRME
ncbi:hypothetical protein QJQ45_017165 [Haematococcus lacustris]|nr:hypothetical protein QJQ45_017165 [Haematococcus lacustris]